MVVMVDLGATQNFISEEVVKRIRLQVKGTKEFEVAFRKWRNCKGKRGLS